jgi:acyl-homoserine-lactone acylase
MKEGKALALRLAGLDQPHLFEQYWDMARARSFAEWERAVRRLQMPMFTFMYADAAGHIYHLFGGRTPVRAGGDWRQWSGIVPGDSSKNLWTRTHPYSELPRWFDPPSGWLQNANDPPWTTTFPPTVRRAQFPPYMAPSGMGLRPQRSARMLMEDSSVTFDEAVEYKLSTRMEAAGRMLPELLEAAAGSPAAAVLEKWDRCADAQSRGAVLFTAFYDEYMRRTKGAIWREPWSEERPMETPRGLSDPRLAAASLEEAYKAVAKLAGSADVAWGDVHRLRLGDLDLPGNGASGEYGVFRVTAFSNPRTGKRVATGGDSFVAVVEFSRPVRARVLLSYGNSSQPGSKHRTDQLPLYSRKELRTPWFTRAEIEKNLERREALP